MKRLSSAQAALVTLLDEWLRCPDCGAEWFSALRLSPLPDEGEVYQLTCTACGYVTITVFQDRIRFAGTRCRIWP